MYDKKLISQDFNKASSSYDERAKLQNIVACEVLKRALTIFSPNDKLLDLGAGTGFIMQENTAQFDTPQLDITQLDIAYEMCLKSAEYGSVINADIEHLPIKKESLDGVISSLALQWCDISKSAAESCRVLKNEGKIIFSTLLDGTLGEMKETMLEITGSAHSSSYLSPEELEEAFVKSGFGDVKIEIKDMKKEYDDVKTMINSIKGIGAGNKREDRKNAITKTQFHALKDFYEKQYSCENGVFATWKICYLSAVKL